MQAVGKSGVIYDFKDWHDMIWYDMILHDMIWYHYMTLHDMIYGMTWHDNMKWHDMIWYDTTWYDIIIHYNTVDLYTGKRYLVLVLNVPPINEMWTHKAKRCHNNNSSFLKPIEIANWMKDYRLCLIYL